MTTSTPTLSSLMFDGSAEKVFPFQTVPGMPVRWFIRFGNAGFNSPANNRDGYQSRAKALAAIRHYAEKGARPLTFGRAARF